MSEPIEISTNPKDMVGRTKPALHLFPTSAVILGSEVMALGAKKYKSPYNWRKYKVAMTVYLDAADRHLKSFLDGEDLDQESGKSHLAHGLCCFAILLDAIVNGTAIDDRPTPGKSAELIRELTKVMAPKPEPPQCCGGTCGCETAPPPIPSYPPAPARIADDDTPF